MLLNTVKEDMNDIKPGHKIESVVNSNLEEQIYKMLRITATANECYPSLYMTNKTDYMFAQDDLVMYVNNDKNHWEDKAFVHYRFLEMMCIKMQVIQEIIERQLILVLIII